MCKQKEICVSASALSDGWLFGGEVGSGGTGRQMGGWGECVTSCPGVVWPSSGQQWHLVGVGVLL